MTSVTELDFSDSDLSAISNNAFTGMAGLVTLNLAWNRITADGLPGGCFAGLTGLRNLYLRMGTRDSATRHTCCALVSPSTMRW